MIGALGLGIQDLGALCVLRPHSEVGLEEHVRAESTLRVAGSFKLVPRRSATPRAANTAFLVRSGFVC